MPKPKVRKVRTHRRRARDDAIEVRREALRHHHALATARGAADEVRTIGRLPIVLRDHLLRDDRHGCDALIEKVERGLLVLEEAGVESRSLMSGIGARDREAACQRRALACIGPAYRRLNGAVQSATALKQESPVPV